MGKVIYQGLVLHLDEESIEEHKRLVTEACARGSFEWAELGPIFVQNEVFQNFSVLVGPGVPIAFLE